MTTTPVRSVTARMVRTAYIGPTNYKPGRVKAWSLGAGNRPGFRIVVSWDHGKDVRENHEAAAVALLAKIDSERSYGTAADFAYDTIIGSSEDGGGYVFAFVAAQEVAK